MEEIVTIVIAKQKGKISLIILAGPSMMAEKIVRVWIKLMCLMIISSRL